MKVATTWHNMGWGYCPTNIPQWNQKYKLGIAVLDSDGKPVKVVADKSSDLSKWLREAPASYETSVDLGGLAPGRYKWAVGLVDVTAGNVPGLEMAVDQKLLNGGWLPAGNLTIE